MGDGIFDRLVSEGGDLALGGPGDITQNPHVKIGFGAPPSTPQPASGSLYLRQDPPNASLMLYVASAGIWSPIISASFADISVANEAALTAQDTTGLPDGAVAFVRSHRSYWTLRTQALGTIPHEIIAASAATRQWCREIARQHWSWTEQTTWVIDAATGNDENSGTNIGTALQTFAELRRRTVFVTQSINVVVPVDLQNTDVVQWQPILMAEGPVSITITGTVILGANHAVVGANTHAQAGNEAPLLDAGFAFVPGQIVQATSGLLNGNTAVIVELVAGTQFRTTKWMGAGGVIAAGVPANNDTVAVQTLPIVPELGLASPNVAFTVSSLSITQIDATLSVSLIAYFKCSYAGYNASGCSAASQGCSVGGAFFAAVGGHTRLAFSGCGFVAPWQLTIQNNAVVDIESCVFVETNVGIGSSAIAVSDGAVLTIGDLGIFSTDTGTMLDVFEGGFCDVQAGPLYGTSATALFATRVHGAATMMVQDAVTPTLTTTAGGGQELEVDELGSGASVLPPLVSGAVVPALAALKTWGGANAWNAQPFNRTYLGMGSTANAATTKAFGTRLTTHA